MDIQDLAAPCGQTIIPGTKGFFYLACACDITTFPGFVATTTVGDKLQLDGDIVLAAGKKFAKIEITTETGRIKHNGVGVKGSKNFTNSFDYKTPKSLASDEWHDANPNGCFVALIPQKDGSFRVIGNKDIPAFMEVADADGGADNGDAAEWTAQIMDKTGRVAPYYTGAIDVTA